MSVTCCYLRVAANTVEDNAMFLVVLVEVSILRNGRAKTTPISIQRIVASSDSALFPLPIMVSEDRH
jgi:hypothetical protein